MHRSRASKKNRMNEASHHRSFSLGKMLLLRRRFCVRLLHRDSAHSHDDHNFPHLVLWFFRLRLGGISRRESSSVKLVSDKYLGIGSSVRPNRTPRHNLQRGWSVLRQPWPGTRHEFGKSSRSKNSSNFVLPAPLTDVALRPLIWCGSRSTKPIARTPLPRVEHRAPPLRQSRLRQLLGRSGSGGSSRT